MMRPDLPFPSPDPAREVPRRDFQAFAQQQPDDALARVCNTISVNGVTAVWYRCRENWMLARRRIPDDMFLYIIRGGLDIAVDGQRLFVEDGQAVHFRRGEWHAAAARHGCPFECISLHYTAQVFDSLALSEVLEFPSIMDWRDEPAALQLLGDACRAFLHRPPGYSRLLEAIVTQFLFFVIDVQVRDQSSPKAIKPPMAELARIMPALEMMRHDLATPPAIGQLAKRCGLSEKQFRRVFRHAIGQLPVQYLRKLRMERACALLQRTNLTVSEIAAAVGYEEPAFFARTFTKLQGLPPGRFRQQEAI